MTLCCQAVAGVTEKLLPDFNHLSPQAVVSFQHIGNFVASVHDGGMITPAKCIADLRKRIIRFLSQEVHSDLAGQGDFTRAFAAQQAVGFNPK